MNVTKSLLPYTACLAALFSCVSCASGPDGSRGVSSNADARRIDTDSRAALRSLYRQNPKAASFAKSAKGVLVFPGVTKAGFVFGGAVGDGALYKSGRPTGYYRSVAASWGLQAGAQKYSYVLFLMDELALANLRASGGWDIGSAPSLTVIDTGVAGSFTTRNLQEGGTYAVFFNQQGLMAGLGLQGTKITRLNIQPKQQSGSP